MRPRFYSTADNARSPRHAALGAAENARFAMNTPNLRAQKKQDTERSERDRSQPME